MRFSFALAFLLLVAATPSFAEVYRCGNVYQQEPCAGGRLVDASPPVSDPEGPSLVRIYLCRKPGGALFWVPDHCRGRGWMIEDTQLVSARSDWADQVREAKEKRQAVRRSVPAPVPTVPAPSAPSAYASRGQCELLNERIRELDAKGRAGSRYYDLDWLRKERQKTRDAQFRLRC